jgi:hypothetical protein
LTSSPKTTLSVPFSSIAQLGASQSLSANGFKAAAKFPQEYRPGAHDLHVEDLGSRVWVPGLQTQQLDDDHVAAAVPAGHSSHIFEPFLAANSPGRQAEHSVSPGAELKLPAGQTVHWLAARRGCTCPASHIEQISARTGVDALYPVGHALHSSAWSISEK